MTQHGPKILKKLSQHRSKIDLGADVLRYVVIVPVLGALGAVLGPSWGALGGVLGASWALLGASWGHRGRSWGRLGVLGNVRGVSGAILRQTHENG